MDGETARLIVIGVTAVGALAWLAALTTLIGASREIRSTTDPAVRFDVESTPSGPIVGRAEVEGSAEELSIKLAGLLAREGMMGPFGPVKVLAQDAREVAFEAAGAYGNGFRRGRVRLAQSGQRTRMDYAIETTSRPTVLLGVGWAFLVLGLVALVAGPWLALSLAVPHPNPNVRAQAVQVVQMVHLLWPPFLFAFLARQPARAFRSRADAMLANLPYA